MEITWLHRWTTAWFSLIPRLTHTHRVGVWSSRKMFLDVNMNQIESRPFPSTSHRFLFYMSCFHIELWSRLTHSFERSYGRLHTTNTRYRNRTNVSYNFYSIGIPFCSIICGLIFHWLPYGTDICVAFFILTLFVFFFLITSFLYWSLCIYIVSSAKHK